MGISIEGLFTTALGLSSPWEVDSVVLDPTKNRIDFEVRNTAPRLTCPACGVTEQPRHDTKPRSWRHLDFFQYAAWVHCPVPRVSCSACNKTTQVEVPWAKPGSGFTLLFEALALNLCQHMPVAQVAKLLRTSDGPLWRRIDLQVTQARAQESFATVRHIGIDETSVRKGHQYVTVVHDLDAKRLLFATEGRDHTTVEAFAKDLKAHQASPDQIEHVCMDMSKAYILGAQTSLPSAQISFDRFHVAQMAARAMDEVRKAELRENPWTFRAAFTQDSKKSMRKLMWAMRTDESGWSKEQKLAMEQLQASTLRSALAWRLKTGLREIYEAMRQAPSKAQASLRLGAWCQWAEESGLKPYQTLAATIKERWSGVIMGMLDWRSNAYVEAMNGMLQQAKRAARGFRTTKNLIAIAYLRMGKLTHLPEHPFKPVAAR
jgi:transposase